MFCEVALYDELQGLWPDMDLYRKTLQWAVGGMSFDKSYCLMSHWQYELPHGVMCPRFNQFYPLYQPGNQCFRVKPLYYLCAALGMIMWLRNELAASLQHAVTSSPNQMFCDQRGTLGFWVQSEQLWKHDWQISPGQYDTMKTFLFCYQAADFEATYSIGKFCSNAGSK